MIQRTTKGQVSQQIRRVKEAARVVRVKGERVFLDEMPPDSDGQLEMNFDCGVFCDGEKA